MTAPPLMEVPGYVYKLFAFGLQSLCNRKDWLLTSYKKQQMPLAETEETTA